MCYQKWQGLTDNQSLNICGVVHQIPWSLYETCTSPMHGIGNTWGWFWKIQRSGWGYLCTKYGVHLINLTTSSKARMFHPLKNWQLIQWGMQYIRMGVKKNKISVIQGVPYVCSTQTSDQVGLTMRCALKHPKKRCELDNFCIYIDGWSPAHLVVGLHQSMELWVIKRSGWTLPLYKIWSPSNHPNSFICGPQVQ